MEDKKYTTNEEKLIAFVTGHTDQWRTWRDTEYVSKWDEYERLWRGIFMDSDKTRASERSKIITPVLQDAIESYQAEIEEATFGRNCFFDIVDDDEERTDIELVKKNLYMDFKKDKIEQAISEIITLGAVYGTGIGEIIVQEKDDKTPATQELIPGLNAVGVSTKSRFSVSLLPIHPKNFLIDPNANDIEGAMGVAIEEQVSIHGVIQAIEAGTYRECNLKQVPADPDLGPTQDINDFQHGKVTLLRYYGFVPRALLENLDNDKDELSKALESEDQASPNFEDYYEDLVEAIIVIANGANLLKAEKNPYMMGDRPVVFFPCERIPKRFYGRGIAEKGFNMQKAIDAQLRSHLDSLALTAAPMMGMDATRMPRGVKFEVYPGRSILTNGSPAEVLQPLQFGQTSPQMAETALLFERMLQKGTGTLDASGLASDAASGQARTGAVAMSLGGIIKKNRKSLQAFQSFFLVPFVQKAAWRYMQFDPDRYPSQDYEFMPVSTLGIIAREYEQQQLLGMMSTLGGDSPLVPMLLQGIVENSSLTNREELVKNLAAMSQPDPAAQQAQQEVQQLQKAMLEAQVKEASAKAFKAEAEAQKVYAEIELMPEELRVKVITALTKNSEDESEFAKRIKLAETIQKDRDLDLKEKDIDSNERIAYLQMKNRNKSQ